MIHNDMFQSAPPISITTLMSIISSAQIAIHSSIPSWMMTWCPLTHHPSARAVCGHCRTRPVAAETSSSSAKQTVLEAHQTKKCRLDARPRPRDRPHVHRHDSHQGHLRSHELPRTVAAGNTPLTSHSTGLCSHPALS